MNATEICLNLVNDRLVIPEVNRFTCSDATRKHSSKREHSVQNSTIFQQTFPMLITTMRSALAVLACTM